MKNITKIWQNLIIKLSFGKKSKEDSVESLEQRVAKLEKLNVALVKKLVSLGHVDPSLPGENALAKDAREERTIH